MRIAILHSRVKLAAKRSNARRHSILIDKVVSTRTVDLIVLPAYPFTGPLIGYYPPSKARLKLRELAEKISEKNVPAGPSVSFMSRWSQEYGVYILGGPIIERAGPRIYVTTVLTSPDGSIAGKYRKVSLTEEERDMGISPGKEPGIFKLKVNGSDVSLGVFSDEDLATPEIFRHLQLGGSKMIIGTIFPYNSSFLGGIIDDEGLVTMDHTVVKTFLEVRSRETGVPIILVGSIIDSGVETIAYMSTIPVEPDEGVIEDKMFGPDDESPIFIDLNEKATNPRKPPEHLKILVKSLCRNNSWRGNSLF
ncbi:hypothetical protein apy_06610 [Aeropyrum pernix]|uniref:CN hydrolase domain-containing protein n=1 Tax=Aeropyrum pernix TaxID=56636 RepID=A0A401H8Z3_AERPX|nr:carbon-nitrogen hydrolase family protein [Aeropyrum pernix]GBF08936.1 hypothetical protein apy_06610 [Aeropyrum pernix]